MATVCRTTNTWLLYFVVPMVFYYADVLSDIILVYRYFYKSFSIISTKNDTPISRNDSNAYNDEYSSYEESEFDERKPQCNALSFFGDDVNFVYWMFACLSFVDIAATGIFQAYQRYNDFTATGRFRGMNIVTTVSYLLMLGPLFDHVQFTRKQVKRLLDRRYHQEKIIYIIFIELVQATRLVLFQISIMTYEESMMPQNVWTFDRILQIISILTSIASTSYTIARRTNFYTEGVNWARAPVCFIIYSSFGLSRVAAIITCSLFCPMALYVLLVLDRALWLFVYVYCEQNRNIFIILVYFVTTFFTVEGVPKGSSYVLVTGTYTVLALLINSTMLGIGIAYYGECGTNSLLQSLVRDYAPPCFLLLSITVVLGRDVYLRYLADLPLEDRISFWKREDGSILITFRIKEEWRNYSVKTRYGIYAANFLLKSINTLAEEEVCQLKQQLDKYEAFIDKYGVVEDLDPNDRKWLHASISEKHRKNEQHRYALLALRDHYHRVQADTSAEEMKAKLEKYSLRLKNCDVKLKELKNVIYSEGIYFDSETLDLLNEPL